MQIPCVKAIFALQRRVRNEAAWFREILRFQEVSVEPSVLLAVIEPDHRILTMIASHFADRLNPERFMIYDKGHCEVMIHVPEQPWYIRALTVQECAQLDVLWSKEEYVILWKTFLTAFVFRSVAMIHCRRIWHPRNTARIWQNFNPNNNRLFSRQGDLFRRQIVIIVVFWYENANVLCRFSTRDML